jgi:hypothetical protein
MNNILWDNTLIDDLKELPYTDTMRYFLYAYAGRARAEEVGVFSILLWWEHHTESETIYVGEHGREICRALGLRPGRFKDVVFQLQEMGVLSVTEYTRDNFPSHVSLNPTLYWKRYPRPKQDRTWGKVYLLKSGSYYKIGKAVNDEKRVRRLKIQLPEPVEHIHSISSMNCHWLEWLWQTGLDRHRLNGEWFNLAPEDVAWFCSFQELDHSYFPHREQFCAGYREYCRRYGFAPDPQVLRWKKQKQ